MTKCVKVLKWIRLKNYLFLCKAQKSEVFNSLQKRIAICELKEKNVATVVLPLRQCYQLFS